MMRRIGQLSLALMVLAGCNDGLQRTAAQVDSVCLSLDDPLNALLLDALIERHRPDLVVGVEDTRARRKLFCEVWRP